MRDQDDVRVCAYCGTSIDVSHRYWVVERCEGSRAVARGFACSYGCLHAIAAFDRSDRINVDDFYDWLERTARRRHAPAKEHGAE